MRGQTLNDPQGTCLHPVAPFRIPDFKGKAAEGAVMSGELVIIIIFGHGRINVVCVEHLYKLLIAIDCCRKSDFDLREIDLPYTASFFRHHQGP